LSLRVLVTEEGGAGSAVAVPERKIKRGIATVYMAPASDAGKKRKIRGRAVPPKREERKNEHRQLIV